jgi:hypothetical protein
MGTNVAMKCHLNLNPKKKVRQLMKSVRKDNLETQKESKPNNSTEKLLKQARKGPEEKKSRSKKIRTHRK